LCWFRYLDLLYTISVKVSRCKIGLANSPNKNFMQIGLQITKLALYTAAFVVITINIQVDLTREIVFRNSKLTFSGVPVIASNMDTVGTFEMAKALAKVPVTGSFLP
jgi:hypothetical protein